MAEWVEPERPTEESLPGPAKPGKCITGGRHRYQDGKCIRCEATQPGYGAKKRTRTPQRKTGGLTHSQIQQTIMGLGSLIQTLVLMIAPQFRDDALDAGELDMLADALADEVQMSKTATKVVKKISEQSGHAKLIVCLVVILTPRFVRRGILPQDFNGIRDTVQMAAGGAPSADWGNGEREIDISGELDDALASLDSDSDETGRREIPEPVGNPITQSYS